MREQAKELPQLKKENDRLNEQLQKQQQQSERVLAEFKEQLIQSEESNRNVMRENEKLCQHIQQEYAATRQLKKDN